MICFDLIHGLILMKATTFFDATVISWNSTLVRDLVLLTWLIKHIMYRGKSSKIQKKYTRCSLFIRLFVGLVSAFPEFTQCFSCALMWWKFIPISISIVISTRHGCLFFFIFFFISNSVTQMWLNCSPNALNCNENLCCKKSVSTLLHIIFSTFAVTEYVIYDTRVLCLSNKLYNCTNIQQKSVKNQSIQSMLILVGKNSSSKILCIANIPNLMFEQFFQMHIRLTYACNFVWFHR